MTNFPNGLTTSTINTTGAVGVGGTLAVTGASTLASAAVTGLTNSGTLKVGGGDTINSIKTYTSSGINIAAANVVATSYQVLDLTVTGVVNTDTILKVQAVNAVANQFVAGATITAANTVEIALYSAINVNAATLQTFNCTIKR